MMISPSLMTCWAYMAMAWEALKIFSLMNFLMPVFKISLACNTSSLSFILLLADRFYLVLFSTLRQTRGTHVARWFWMSDCILFTAHFEYPQKRCTDSTVWLLHGWFHGKLLPSRRKFCVHCSTMNQVTVLQVFWRNLNHAPGYSVTGFLTEPKPCTRLQFVFLLNLNYNPCKIKFSSSLSLSQKKKEGFSVTSFKVIYI